MEHFTQRLYLGGAESEETYGDARYQIMVNATFLDIDNEDTILAGQVLLMSEEDGNNGGEDFVWLDQEGDMHLAGDTLLEIYHQESTDNNDPENLLSELNCLLHQSIETVRNVEISAKLFSGVVETHENISIFEPTVSDAFSAK